LFEQKQVNQAIADKLACIQLAVTAGIALTLWVFLDPKPAWSALLGGAICSLATWLMSRIMFARGGNDAGQMLMAFYLGEAAKVVFTVVCFLLVFILLDLNAPAFILTYIAMLILHWLALLKTKT
jgi:F0F1-type ATP synthase assembly protein I